jgi:hypothetical protein
MLNKKELVKDKILFLGNFSDDFYKRFKTDNPQFELDGLNLGTEVYSPYTTDKKHTDLSIKIIGNYGGKIVVFTDAEGKVPEGVKTTLNSLAGRTGRAFIPHFPTTILVGTPDHTEDNLRGLAQQYRFKHYLTNSENLSEDIVDRFDTLRKEENKKTLRMIALGVGIVSVFVVISLLALVAGPYVAPILLLAAIVIGGALGGAYLYREVKQWEKEEYGADSPTDGDKPSRQSGPVTSQNLSPAGLPPMPQQHFGSPISTRTTGSGSTSVPTNEKGPGVNSQTQEERLLLPSRGQGSIN